MERKINDLSDITFIIPVRIDSIDRLENLLFTTNFLLNAFQTNIIVWEADARNTSLLQQLLNPNVTYIFHEDPDSVFYRTKYINTVAKTVNTPYIAVWDTDVIVQTSQIEAALLLLRENKADFVYPYKDVMLNVPSCVKNIFFKCQDIAILEKLSSGFRSMYGRAIGGGFFANKAKYIEAGMENEYFYGWGLEDGERLLRWKKLNCRIEQVEGTLFHLDHSRGENSHFHSKVQKSFKWREKFRISNLSDFLLKQEIATWHG